MQKLNTKKGITLISMIITIILMLILVGVTISISLDGGLFKTAKESTDKTQSAMEEEEQTRYEYEIAKRTGKIDASYDDWVNASPEERTDYMNAKAEDPTSVDTLNSFVIERDIMEAYDIAQKEETVGNTLRLGAKVTYSEPEASTTSTAGSTATISTLNETGTASVEKTTDASDVEWAILGIEDGCLLLVATSNVNGTGYFDKTITPAKVNGVDQRYSTTYTEGSVPTYGFSNGRADYLNNSAINELNTFCAENYGNGEGAIEARSINVDDINKITGYDPMLTGAGTISQAGRVTQYGNEVTYKLASDGKKIAYTSDVESKDSTDSKLGTYTKFQNIDGTSITDADDTFTVKNTYYWYSPDTLSEYEDASVKGISKDSALYNVLFANTTFQAGSYWLASPCECTCNNYVYWGMRTVHNENVATTGVWYSWGIQKVLWMGVRPVVKISADALLTYDSTAESWNIAMPEQS